MSEKTKEALAKVRAELKRLAEDLARGHTEEFLRYLEVMGRFHRYSLHNSWLIYRQKPEATLVAGFQRWKELGRYVRKGEKGILILAPIVKKVVDEETGEEARQVVGFKAAHVFDISQTEGKPLPQYPAASGPEDLYSRLVRACPFPVEEALFPEGTRGRTDGRTIWVARNIPPADKAKVLLHEWAHALLHFEAPTLPRPVEELEAEAVAYAVGRKLGLDPRDSADYILSWAGSGAQEHLEAVVPRVVRAAQEVLSRVLEPTAAEEAERAEALAA